MPKLRDNYQMSRAGVFIGGKRQLANDMSSMSSLSVNIKRASDWFSGKFCKKQWISLFLDWLIDSLMKTDKTLLFLKMRSS